ncbi:hypothetical protein WA538_003345 [Blastocystis sp. DL]
MIDITLLILLILFPVFTIIIGCRLVSYYLSDDFSKGFYWGKFVFILCITVTVSAICFFPLDVANAGASIDCTTGDKQCGGFNFTAIWYSLFGIIVVLMVVVLPFTIFFYETMDIEQPPLCKRLQTAFGYTITVVVVVAALTWIFCMIVNKAYIAITEFEVTAANSFLVSESEVPSLIIPDAMTVMNATVLSTEEMRAADSIFGTAATLEIKVTWFVRMLTLFCVVGWLFFVVFAGIGVIGLPYKLIHGFLNRPTYMPKDRFDQEKKILGQRIQALIAQGESITRMMESAKTIDVGWREKRRLKKESKKAAEEYRNACKELDTDYLTLRAQHLNYKDNNPLLPVFSLLLGILAVIASLLWLLQLALYVFPRQLAGYAVAPFLNSLFSRLARLFPILAAALLLALALYFMFCTTQGAFSFGLKLLLLDVHPMEPHDTLITSLVFNGGLMLLTVLPLLQFCVKAFGDYAAEAEVVDILRGCIFGVQMEYLRFVSWLFQNNFFMWLMLAFIFLSAIYYSCRRTDKERKMKKTIQKLKEEDQHGIELMKKKEERDKQDMA